MLSWHTAQALLEVIVVKEVMLARAYALLTYS